MLYGMVDQFSHNTKLHMIIAIPATEIQKAEY